MIFGIGDTSKSIDIQIVDDTGLPVTGLVSATFPTLKYSLAGANADATITTSDLALTTTAYSSGGVKERGEGVYRLDLPNAALATQGAVKVRGEASGKRVICEPIVVGLVADLTQALPSAPVANSVGEALFIADNLAGRIGTAQAGGASTITLDSGASSVDGRYVGYGVYLYGGTGGGIRGVGQERTIVAYVGSTKVATLAQAWGTNPDSTSKFILYVNPFTNVGIWNGTVVATPATAGIPDVNAKNWNNLTTVALPLIPTVAGRTLDVSAGGEAGLDWANVGSPTTTLALTGTTVASTQKVDVETIKTNPVVNAGTITFPTGATLASTTNITAGTITTTTNLTNLPAITAGWLTATGIAADAITAAKIADGAIDAATFAAGAINAAAIAADAIGASELAADAVAEIAAGVWDLATSGHTTSGTFGAAMNAAGSAGDPWSTSVPGAYGAGTAGFILGTNLDSTVTSRSSQISVNTIAGYVDTEVAAIKTKTDNLPSDPADASDIAAAFSTVNGTLATIAGYIDTEVAAIKSKTDLIPAAPASTTNITAGTITTVTTLTGLTASDVGAIKAKTDHLPGSDIVHTLGKLWVLDGDGNAVAPASATTQLSTDVGTKPTLAQILAGGDVDGYTLEQTLKLCLSALAGKLSGAATTTVTIRAADDSKTRITATVDADGNRSAITYDAAG